MVSRSTEMSAQLRCLFSRDLCEKEMEVQERFVCTRDVGASEMHP